MHHVLVAKLRRAEATCWVAASCSSNFCTSVPVCVRARKRVRERWDEAQEGFDGGNGGVGGGVLSPDTTTYTKLRNCDLNRKTWVALENLHVKLAIGVRTKQECW